MEVKYWTEDEGRQYITPTVKLAHDWCGSIDNLLSLA